MTIKQRSNWLKSGAPATIGAINAAVVVSATVAEPCATRSATEMRKAATITGMPVSESILDKASPIPLARNTPPNIPPAPVTKMIAQIGPRALLQIFSICS